MIYQNQSSVNPINSSFFLVDWTIICFQRMCSSLFYTFIMNFHFFSLSGSCSLFFCVCSFFSVGKAFHIHVLLTVHLSFLFKFSMHWFYCYCTAKVQIAKTRSWLQQSLNAALSLSLSHLFLLQQMYFQCTHWNK